MSRQVDDGQAVLAHVVDKIAEPRPARAIADDQPARRDEFGAVVRQPRRQFAQPLAQQERDFLAVHPLEQRPGGVAGDDLAMIDEGDPVAQFLRFRQIVGRQQDGRARPVQGPDLAPQLLAQFDVDAGGRLIQHQHRRLVNHRLGDHEPPPHAAGKGARVVFGLVAQLDGREQILGDPLACRYPVETGLEIQQLAWREKGVDVQLLRHHADRGARPARMAVDIDAPDRGRSGGLVDQARQDVDQGRFAGPVRPEQAENGPFGNIEVDSLQRPARREILRSAIGLGEAADPDGGHGVVRQRGRGGGSVGHGRKVVRRRGACKGRRAARARPASGGLPKACPSAAGRAIPGAESGRQEGSPTAGS